MGCGVDHQFDFVVRVFDAHEDGGVVDVLLQFNEFIVGVRLCADEGIDEDAVDLPVKQLVLSVRKVDVIGGGLLTGAKVDHSDRIPNVWRALRSVVGVDHEVASDDGKGGVAVE